MIVVEIQDPEDGRVSHEVGPFATEDDAKKWKTGFVLATGFDEDFVEVHDVDRELCHPVDDYAMLHEFYDCTI
jgi:hypothetical protein